MMLHRATSSVTSGMLSSLLSLLGTLFPAIFPTVGRLPILSFRVWSEDHLPRSPPSSPWLGGGTSLCSQHHTVLSRRLPPRSPKATLAAMFKMVILPSYSHHYKSLTLIYFFQSIYHLLIYHILLLGPMVILSFSLTSFLSPGIFGSFVYLCILSP